MFTFLFAFIGSAFIDPENVLGCVKKLYVGHIQPIHTHSLPPQVCLRLWIGFQSGVKTCSLQFIYFPSSYSFKPSFVDFCIVFIIFIGSALINSETCPRVC